ncbi:MAG: regulatory protein GemA [Magnetococcales bacterium]|nr:regulatory protein GemA [Magnetococcales bacterium]
MLARAGHIQKIHIAKTQLGLNDDAYRALLEAQTGKTSCSTMTDPELQTVLQEFQRLGWRPTIPGPPVPPVGEAQPPPQSRWMSRPTNWNEPTKNPSYRKIYAMICANEAHDWSWGYVRGTARKMFEKARGDVVLEWLTPQELHKLVSALAIHSARLKREK